MSVSIAFVGVSGKLRSEIESIKLGASYIEWEVAPLLEAAPETVPASVVIGSETGEIPTAEISQLLKMYFPDVPLYYATLDRKTVDKKLFAKNGCDDIFLFPSDKKSFEYRLQDDLTKASNGELMFLRSVSLMDIEAGEELGFDLFVHLPANNKYIRFSGATEPLDKQRAERLQSHRVTSVHVKTNQMSAFYKASAKKLRSLENSKGISETELKEKRERAVRSLLTDVLQSGSGEDSFENGQKILSDCREIVSSYVKGDKEQNSWYQKMMTLAEDSSSCYTKAANTSTFAALLSIGLGIGNAEEIALAALLQDIGLADLPPELVEKPESDRTPAEEALYRTHPELSLKIIKDRKIAVTDVVIRAIAEHQERFDGSGYPKAYEGKRISVEAQILALADQLASWCVVQPGQARKEPLNELEKFYADFSADPSKAKFDPKLILKVLSLFKGTTDKASQGAA